MGLYGAETLGQLPGLTDLARPGQIDRWLMSSLRLMADAKMSNDRWQIVCRRDLSESGKEAVPTITITNTITIGIAITTIITIASK